MAGGESWSGLGLRLLMHVHCGFLLLDHLLGKVSRERCRGLCGRLYGGALQVALEFGKRLIMRHNIKWKVWSCFI